MELRAHFGNQPKNDLNDEPNRFKPATNKPWIPQAHHTINTFLEAFQNDIKQYLGSNKTENTGKHSKRFEKYSP